LGVWFWCADQYIVERVLASKDLSEARKGTIFVGFLKLVSGTTLLFPGIVVFAICSSDHALFEQGFNVLTNSEASFPMGVKYLLPAGLKGLIFGALMVGLVSSLSNVFNSCSSLYIQNYFIKENPNASHDQIHGTEQAATICMVLLAILWLPVLKFMTEANGLFYSLQQIQAYISPPIAAVFIFGVFNKKVNARGAIHALIIGCVIGISKLSLDILCIGYNQPGIDSLLPIGSEGFMASIMSINYLYYAFFMFVLCSLILFVSSIKSEAPTDSGAEQLLYQNIGSTKDSKRSNYLIWSVLLVVALVVVWLIFSPIGIA